MDAPKETLKSRVNHQYVSNDSYYNTKRQSSGNSRKSINATLSNFINSNFLPLITAYFLCYHVVKRIDDFLRYKNVPQNFMFDAHVWNMLHMNRYLSPDAAPFSYGGRFWNDCFRIISRQVSWGSLEKISKIWCIF